MAESIATPEHRDAADAPPTPVEEESVDSGQSGGWFTLANGFGILVALFGLVVGARTLVDNSFLTHLATGELILDRGRVPSVDPYSRTAAGEPWTVQSWFVSVIYAGLDRLFGLTSVRLMHGAIGAAVAVALWRLTAPAKHAVTRLGLVLLPIILGIGFWSPRPLMFGLLAMVILLGLIQTERSPWILVPLMWIWANSHGSYPLAFVLLGAVGLGAIFDDRVLPRREMTLVAYAALGTLLAVAGPLGLRVLWFPFHLLGRREALDGVVEWQAPSFTTPSELAYLLTIPLIAVAARRGAPWRALLPSLLFVATGMLAIRNIAVASVIVIVMCAPAFAGWLRTSDGSETGLVGRTLGRAALAGVIVATLAVAVTPAVDLSRYPVEQIDFLEERGLLPSDGVEVIHRDAVGNYLGYRYGDDASVFIDDRFDFYPLELTADHLVLLDGGDFRDVLTRRDAEVVLWQADEKLTIWLADEPNWRVAIADDEWVVACRSDTAVAERCFG